MVQQLLICLHWKWKQLYCVPLSPFWRETLLLDLAALCHMWTWSTCVSPVMWITENCILCFFLYFKFRMLSRITAYIETAPTTFSPSSVSKWDDLAFVQPNARTSLCKHMTNANWWKMSPFGVLLPLLLLSSPLDCSLCTHMSVSIWLLIPIKHAQAMCIRDRPGHKLKTNKPVLHSW